MPRYYFDTDNDDRFDRDEIGVEFVDATAARRAAIDVLPDLARDRLPDSDRRTFTVRMRDEAGTVLYSAKLELSGEWHVEAPVS